VLNQLPAANDEDSCRRDGEKDGLEVDVHGLAHAGQGLE
jgi:hypothetical protein